MRTVRIRYNQSLADIALEQYGDVRGIFWLLEDNQQLLSSVDNLEEGSVLFIRNDSINKTVATAMLRAGVATMTTDAQPHGVGFDVIQKDLMIYA